jgi:hypothetical protein
MTMKPETIHVFNRRAIMRRAWEVAGAVNASALALRVCARGALTRLVTDGVTGNSLFARARVRLFRSPMEGRSRNTFPKPAFFTWNACNACNFNDLHL